MFSKTHFFFLDEQLPVDDFADYFCHHFGCRDHRYYHRVVAFYPGHVDIEESDRETT
jgi:hypothetical protein